MFSTHTKKRSAASLHEPGKTKQRRAKKTEFDFSNFVNEFIKPTSGRNNNDPQLEIINRLKSLAKRITNSTASENLTTDDIKEILIRLILPDTDTDINTRADYLSDQIKLAGIKRAITHRLTWKKAETIQRLTHFLDLFLRDNDESILKQLAEDKASNINQNFSDCFITLHTMIKHIETAGSSEDLNYFADFLAISRLLSRRAMVYPYLDQLEQALQMKAAASNSESYVIRENGSRALALNIKNIFSRKKLLSSVLYDWASANGFQSRSKILRELSPANFSRLLSSMSLMKDAAIAVGTDTHGVWSHAIQWYIVFEHQKRTNFLQHSPSELYQHSLPAWNAVFDIIDYNDFTSPDHVTKLLAYKDAEQRWPLLAGTYIRAQAKMHCEYFDYDDHLRKKHGFANYNNGFETRSLNN